MRRSRRVLTVLLLACGLVGLASCGEKPAPTESDSTVEVPELDQNKSYFDITSKLKLTRPYKGKDFFEDGIGEAKLLKVRDGDTAEFQLTESNERVVIRYYCIDTPESTGKVEKWGKAASIFSKEILENAKEIVLEASTTPASTDSYGSRYLGYVWYKMEDNSDWMNINLLMVENGYSLSYCVPGSIEYPYYQNFKAAEDFAKAGKLHINGTAKDPLFSTKAIPTTIKDLVEDPYAFYNEETDLGSKVSFEGYISDLDIYDDQYHFTATAMIDGKLYNMPLYAGYGHTSAARGLHRGAKYNFVGYIQKHNGKFQISGMEVDDFATSDDYCTELVGDYYLTFNDTDEYKISWGKSLYTAATITAAVIDGENIKLTATATFKKDKAGAAKEFTILVPNTNKLNDSSVSSLVGKKASFKGIQEEKGIVTVLKYSDIEFK